MKWVNSKTIAWAALAGAVICALVLQNAVVHKRNLWDVLPFVVLMDVALGCALASCLLAWRRKSHFLREAATVIATLIGLVWLQMWCEPLQDLAGWLMVKAYLWFLV